MTRQVLLLHPEDVTDASAPALMAPEYAFIVDDTVADRVGVSLLLAADPPGDSPDGSSPRHSECLWLSRQTANSRRVWEGEISNGAAGRLLRRPAFAIVESNPIYGQVTSYAGLQVTIRHHAGSTIAPISSVEEVAPLVVFMLYKAPLLRRIATPDAIARAHTRIMDRLLGEHGTAGTRQIRQLLVDIVPVSSHPRPADRITWVDPCTGHDISCTVRHVIDFGFYCDGNRENPGVSLGNHYWEDPDTTSVEDCLPDQQAAVDTVVPVEEPSPDARPAPVGATTGSTVPAAQSRFAEFMDALEDTTTGPFHQTPAQTSVPEATADSGGRARKRYRDETAESDSAQSMRIMSALADQPDLLQHYARHLRSVGVTSQISPYSTASDLIDDRETGSRPERQHSFRPSARQQEVHNLICATEHRGKSPVVFVDFARAARATKFIPHPAILSRLYDFTFGVCGLSVLHFRRFDLAAQLDYASNNQLNAQNFSVKVELPNLPRDPSHADLKTALGVLGTYCDEYLDRHTCRLVSAAKEFAEELSDYGPWSAVEAKTLAFWFSNILAAYRIACDHDIDHGTTTRASIKDRLTLQDSELSGLLLKMSRSRQQGRVPSLETNRSGAPRGDSWDSKPSAQGGRSKLVAVRRQVPTEVGLAAPRQGGKQLCLRFISAQGCPSTTPGRCTYPFLGHFTPEEKLDPIVKAHVQEKLGGLRPDLRNL